MSAALVQAMQAAPVPQPDPVAPPPPAQPQPVSAPAPAAVPAPAPTKKTSGGNGWLYFLLGAAVILIAVAVLLWMSTRNDAEIQPIPTNTPPPIEQPIEPSPEAVQLPS